MSDLGALVERVRNPEHTGENRCAPCTAVNVALALAPSALLAVRSVELAVVAVAASSLAIYLRGYLVPGTPTLTSRYLPDRLLARFDAHTPAEAEAEAEDGETWETVERLERRRRNAVDPEAFLEDAGVVEPDGEGDHRATGEFADRVEGRVRRLRDGSVDREALAGMFDADPGAVTFEDRDYPAITVGHRVRKWPGDAALVADVATHRTLDAWTDRWTDVPLEQRVDVLRSLRAFHDSCPACGGDLRRTTDTVESCCRTLEVAALLCRDCGSRLREFDPSAETPAHGPT